MILKDVEAFWHWVREESYKRGWSIRETERRAGFRPGRINNAARLLRPPTLEMCQGLARAFGLSVIKVQEKAGYVVSRERLTEFYTIAEQLARLPDGPIREEAMAAIRAIAADARRRAMEKEEAQREA